MLFMVLLAPATSHAEDLGLMRLSLIDGEVQVLIQGSTDWTDAAINIPLNEGDRLWVPDGGRAEVQIRGGVFVRADGGTSLDLLSANSDAAQFYLDRGHAYINNRRGGIKAVQVDTPLSSVRSYDNSVMMLDVTEDGVTEVSVLKGYVTAESRAGATRVGAGNTLTIRGEQDAELSPIGSPDAWEQWNSSRDRELSAWGESARYLPDELQEYSEELDTNGRWDYVTDYGYVWAPTVTVVDWAPYTLGRWVWIRGSYVWIAYDPWGWAPYHYGRWVYVTYLGWCWVPPAAGAVYWGPGYVGWTVTPTFVAWVPLAPGELYYGYGYYGPWSVNIATVNANTVPVNRTYVNVRHVRAVNVVRRDSFGTGTRVPVDTRDNPFLDKRHAGRDIAIVPPPSRPKRPVVLREEDGGRGGQRPPEHEQTTHRAFTGNDRPATPPSSTRPDIRRESPPAHVSPEPRRAAPPVRIMPPERVLRNRPDEIKNERRMVRERNASVFRPQAPENLPVKRSNEPRVIIRNPAPQPAAGQPQKRLEQPKREQTREQFERRDGK
jgi:hypothetical protein